MDWFPWYFQIYSAHTMHLNPYQDGCYRRLIDHYMASRQALPDNDSALARIIGDSEANWVAMASPLVRPFFTPKDGMLYLYRCEFILAEQDKRSKKFSESGKNGALKRWNKNNNKDSHPNGHPIATPMAFDSTGQDKTVQYSKKITPLPPKGGTVACPDWLDKTSWESFKAHRGKKFTANAQRLALGKLFQWHQQGHNPTEIINNSIMNGWKGLFEPKGETHEKPIRQLTKHERLIRAGQEALDELCGHSDGWEENLAIVGPVNPEL